MNWRYRVLMPLFAAASLAQAEPALETVEQPASLEQPLVPAAPVPPFPAAESPVPVVAPAVEAQTAKEPPSKAAEPAAGNEKPVVSETSRRKIRDTIRKLDDLLWR